MARSVRLLALAVLLVAGGAPASAGPRPAGQVVAPGYDLFLTPDGGAEVELDVGVAGVPLMTFRGRPLGSFDFGRHGVHEVGAADTIVRRLDAASPASPRVRAELVGLLLESTNVPGYFVTPQSIRPLGLPSTGTLDFEFGENGAGGLLRSELLVNYDVRKGSPTGPIVATGSTGMGFVAEDVLWLHSTDSPDRDCDLYCLTQEGNAVCHEAGAGINHKHCVCPGDGAIPSITGVNHLLNGRDTSQDFHAIGTATSTTDCTGGGGGTCTGTGQAVLGIGLSYFPTVAANVSFTFTFNCAEGGSITGSGILWSASCGKSSGSGTFSGTGETFTIETAGSVLVVMGAATGGGNATPQPDTSTVPFGNSCSSGTARVFQLTGGLAF